MNKFVVRRKYLCGEEHSWYGLLPITTAWPLSRGYVLVLFAAVKTVIPFEEWLCYSLRAERGTMWCGGVGTNVDHDHDYDTTPLRAPTLLR